MIEWKKFDLVITVEGCDEVEYIKMLNMLLYVIGVMTEDSSHYPDLYLLQHLASEMLPQPDQIIGCTKLFRSSR